MQFTLNKNEPSLCISQGDSGDFESFFSVDSVDEAVKYLLNSFFCSAFANLAKY